MKIDLVINKFDNEANFKPTNKHIPKPITRKRKTEEEIKQYQKEYYKNNKDILIKNMKEYRTNNRKQYNDSHNKYNKDNYAKMQLYRREYMKKYRATQQYTLDKEKRKMYMRNYRQKHKRERQVYNKLYYLTYKENMKDKANERHHNKKYTNNKFLTEYINNDNGVIENQIS
jgi:hypothetical protein